MKVTKRSRGIKPSTLEKGDAFEKQVFDVLCLLPGTTAQRHVTIGGKDIDALCKIEDVISGPQTVAFECKDYERPLTRETVALIIAEYQPLLTQSLIDRLCLITRNGIVANAKLCFDEKSTQHLTYDELLERLISPRTLVRNMINRFLDDDLDQYYVSTGCYYLDISWVGSNYPLFYNSFIDFALTDRLPTLSHCAEQWKKYAPDENSAKLSEQYTTKSFEKVIRLRRNNHVSNLEPLVLDWVADNKVPQALAILGSYGMGKSSFAKRLAHVMAKRYENGKTDRIPLLIELRNFGSHQDVMGLITHELMNRHGTRNGSYEFFQALNRQGKFLLILDGFDEMKQGLSKDVLLFNFNELNKLYSPRSKIVLCGRPTIFASEDEQTTILSGKSDADLTHVVEYIQLQIAPFSSTDIFSFLQRYSSVKHSKVKDEIGALVDQLARELRANSDLSTLLSRPVHLPMLVAVLPEWKSSIRALSRAKLYELFIQKTISREVLKRGQRLTNLDVDSRRKFASELAVEMFRLGDSRSIHYSEIPDHIVQSFRRPGQTLDATKRDLVAACFLERKPPDILFFGHKSFAEFLAAERIVALMRETPPNTNTLGFRMSPEILSFVAEIASADDWRAAATSPTVNSKLLDGMLKIIISNTSKDLQFPTGHLETTLGQREVILIWEKQASKLPTKLLFRVVEYMENVVGERPTKASIYDTFLRLLVRNDEDMISVHAFRTLKRANLMDRNELSEVIGKNRLRRWKKYSWID